MIGSISNVRSIEAPREEIDRVNGLLRASECLGGSFEFEDLIVGSARIGHLVLREEDGLNYWLLNEARGGGLITRCGRALIDAAFKHLGMKSVTIFASTTNHASRAVDERLKMTLERIEPDSLSRDGRTYDGARYRFTRDARRPNPS